MTLAIILGLPNRCTAFWCSPARPRRCDSPELLSLRWADMEWEQSRIAVSKRWSKGKDGPTKTRKSEGHIPMHPILAVYLNEWRDHTPYAKDTDFLFPSLKAEGKVPLSPAVFLADHLRPAAKAARIVLEDGQGFGMHNLRHSLSSWLVNKGKVEPKTVQSILRHRSIQTTLDPKPRATAMQRGRRRARSSRNWRCLQIVG